MNRSPQSTSSGSEPDWRAIVLPVLLRPTAEGDTGRFRIWRRTALAAIALALAAALWPLAAARWMPHTAGSLAAPPLSAASAAQAAMTMPAGTRLRDCTDDTRCPWLRVLPPGQFLMGSAPGEAGRSDHEGPQHLVTVAYPLAVAETEVTRDQFAAFVAATGQAMAPGCRVFQGGKWDIDKARDWQSPGFEQTGQHPVVCVNWQDANAYVQWLSRTTGQAYRLLSEAEWEYAARAGAATRFSFGDRNEDLCRHANVADQDAKAKYPDFTWAIDCSDGHANTAPVRSKLANAWGLFDLHGNVWEWVSDCWHDSYRQAPSDGASWQADCAEERRVLGGGGWDDGPDFARAAFRNRGSPDDRISNIGFRVARTLTPPTLTPLQQTPAASK